MLKKYESILIPLMAVFSGLLLGAVIMLIFGYDPLAGYQALFGTAFGSVKNVGEIFRAVAPLIFTALGFAVASKAGFFNIGLSGQAFVGWVFAGWFALENPDLPRPILLIATILIAMIAGGIAGAIPGILRAYLGTSEVIVTIMMNYILLYFSNYLIRNVFAADLMKNADSTIYVSENASYRTEWLRVLTENSRMNLGIFFAIIAVVVIWFLFAKTTLGFEIRAAGLNPNAADYAGMSTKRTIVMSMVISGALAGLGGAVQGIGTFQNVYVQASSMDIGFNGMSVALLASNSPLGIPFAAFLFGTMSVGTPGMQRAQVPPELINVVTASIIFFIGVKFVFEQVLKSKRFAKGDQ
ncbi:ABC transporter permease [Streptococcus plurextorum]|uniref:ABC transporter permease n=1 Tax=Streptococcus plurextorum TaxID=456876 RepID=UPI000428EEB3|nr:ABC transporter permease [Streptococcus plurextorum]